MTPSAFEPPRAALRAELRNRLMIFSLDSERWGAPLAASHPRGGAPRDPPPAGRSKSSQSIGDAGCSERRLSSRHPGKSHPACRCDPKSGACPRFRAISTSQFALYDVATGRDHSVSASTLERWSTQPEDGTASSSPSRNVAMHPRPTERFSSASDPPCASAI